MGAFVDVIKAWGVVPATVTVRQPGGFLTEKFGAFQSLIPEHCPEEARAMARTAGKWLHDFLGETVSVPRRRTMSRAEAIERNTEKDFRHARALVEAMGGEIGILAMDFPEEYGGFEISLADRTAIGIALGANGTSSALITPAGHTGIGLAPILNFGTAAQKAKYLPDMSTGKRISSYALTEPGAGTDIEAMTTTAVRKGDGWVINGTKQFITNAGLSANKKQPGLFVLFAKAEGQITAFLVDGNKARIKVREEHKMGLHGSSTGQVTFDNVRIPADALLGEVGQGKRIALQTLGRGRWGIGIGTAGALHAALAKAIPHAQERQSRDYAQRGSVVRRAIAEFNTIEDMIASVAIAAFRIETLSFAVAGMVEGRLAELRTTNPSASPSQVWADLSAESSTVKVLASSDGFQAMVQALQIWGGYGFIEDYPMAQRVRDHLVDMIFEGANPIHRALILPGQVITGLFQSGLKATEASWQERRSHVETTFERYRESGLLGAMLLAEAQKEMVVLAFGAMMAMTDAMKIMADPSRGQQFGMAFSDLWMRAFESHSVVARALAVAEHAGQAAARPILQLAAASVYERNEEMQAIGRRLLSAARGEGAKIAEGLQNAVFLNPSLDIMDLRAKIAQDMIVAGGYSVRPVSAG